MIRNEGDSVLLVNVPLDVYTDLVRKAERLDILCDEWSNKSIELSQILEALVKVVLAKDPDLKNTINAIRVNPIPFLDEH